MTDKSRMLTRSEATTGAEFHRGECTRVYGPRGGETETVHRYRRTGATKLWKTRPGDFRTPVQYGMRNNGHDYITPDNAEEFHLSSQCPLEHTEYRARHGALIVEVSKWGGGTPGKRYGQGEKWDVRIIGRHGATVLDEVLITGASPQSHREVAEAVLTLLGEGGGR